MPTAARSDRHGRVPGRAAAPPTGKATASSSRLPATAGNRSVTRRRTGIPRTPPEEHAVDGDEEDDVDADDGDGEGVIPYGAANQEATT